MNCVCELVFVLVPGMEGGGAVERTSTNRDPEKYCSCMELF